MSKRISTKEVAVADLISCEDFGRLLTDPTGLNRVATKGNFWEYRKMLGMDDEPNHAAASALYVVYSVERLFQESDHVRCLAIRLPGDRQFSVADLVSKRVFRLQFDSDVVPEVIKDGKLMLTIF